MTRGQHDVPLIDEPREIDGEPAKDAWATALSETVTQVQDRWSLRIGEPFQPGGRTAWVAPVRRLGSEDAALKIAWRHTEAVHEAEGLRCWGGDGAVRLLAVEEFELSIALLVERCVPGTALSPLPEQEQDIVIAELLRRLWIMPPSGHPFRSLEVMCDGWADEFKSHWDEDRSRLDQELVDEAIRLLRTLPSTAERSVLLCTDLHAGNVLAAEREPWLVIDPKPYVGDPCFDGVQHMLNCEERLVADPQALAARMATLLEVDEERVLQWLFARCVQEALHWPQLGDVARRITL